MLVLSRKKKEAIQIGDNIEIKILAIEGDQIKVGIDAPRSMDVYRKEIYVAIQKENNQAASISLDLVKILTENEKI